MWPTEKMCAGIVCGVFASSRGLNTHLCCASTEASGKEVPQE